MTRTAHFGENSSRVWSIGQSRPTAFKTTMARPRTARGVVKLFLLSIAGFLWIVVILKGQDKNAAVVGDGTVSVKTSDLPCQNNILYNDSTFTTALYPNPAYQTVPVGPSLSYKKDGICSLAAETVGEDSLLSASHWWTKHITNVLATSQNSNDPQFIHKEWMMKLLATLTPEMLQKGVKVKPSAASFRKLLNLVHRQSKRSPPGWS
uniref:Uncharacterized protein n=1 Tax=Amphora coffeiformis TaxID=265554 RepID=A0A7S3LF54_9STRA|mmetsp:Transcript_13130/g.26660  ORF Transcript_13130/g.26660 Transcript_13130/m.26660 type:complete len:207 (+) Transcript_13130:145-765(+)